ncbi:hypothetical protein WJX73_006562 [Symbiochloris irregularis]|uniref:Glycosyltransferase 61 catalytic domain-containing protein n=1 Tax=Symbiochloris irregularis TaxID=706552 RepID=A0AAW1NY98_9CHLO
MRTRWRLRALFALGCVVAGLSHGLDEVAQPTESSFFQPQGKSYGVFHNVLLQEKGLLYFQNDTEHGHPNATSPVVPELQSITEANWWWPDASAWKAEGVSRYNATQLQSKCTSWVEQPTIIWQGMPVDDHNIFHFFSDNLLRVFTTLADLGLLDVNTSMARDLVPSSQEANLVLLQLNSRSWSSKFHELYDHLTPDQWSFPHGVGACYRTLVIGSDSNVQCYVRADSQEQQERRIAAQSRFRQWALAKQLQIDEGRGRAIVHPPESQGRMQIKLIQRARNTAGGSRGIVNEDEIISAIQERYGDIADVSLVNFNGSLSTAMLAMNATDVLLGMHGAGMANVLWMRPQGAVVQLVPYGWRRPSSPPPPNPPEASVGIETLSRNANATYFFWENFRPEHAHLSRAHYDSEVKRATSEQRRRIHDWQQHPAGGWAEQEKQFRSQFNTGGEMYDHWKAQDTYVDLDSFMPVVDQAVKAVRSNNKAWAP